MTHPGSLNARTLRRVVLDSPDNNTAGERAAELMLTRG